jgi:hypothetical protein
MRCVRLLKGIAFSLCLLHDDAPCGKRDAWDAFSELPHARVPAHVRVRARARLARRFQNAVPSVPFSTSFISMQVTGWAKRQT